MIRVGWVEEYNAPLLVDFSGVAYFDGDFPCGSGCYRYANGLDVLLEHLLLGLKLTGEIWSYGMYGEIAVNQNERNGE